MSLLTRFRHGRLAALVCLALGAGAANAELAIVLNSGEGTVSLVDMGARKEKSRITVGKEPHHLMATPDGKHLIVANAVSNNLVFLDPASGQVVKRLERISDPYQIGYSPDRRFFVSASLRLDQTDIYEAETFKLLKRIPTPRAPSWGPSRRR